MSRYSGSPITTRMTPDCQSKQQQGDEREPAVEHARDELVQSPVQQFADGVEVARLPRDDAAGRVRLVELQAQALGVQEDPLAQIEHDGLSEARRDDDVPADERRTAERGEQVHGHDADGRHPVHLVDDRGQGGVDAVGDQRRAEHPQSGRDDQDDRGEHELPLQRRDQRSEQAQRATADAAALVPRVVRAVFAAGSFDGCRAHRFTSLSRMRACSSSRLEMTCR